MRRYKEQCEALVKAGAIILVRDGFTEGGIPVYVTRKVTGCFGVKRGRDSEWGVMVDRPFEDGADGVVYNLILGVNVGSKVKTKGLHCDVEICARHFSNEEQKMILSDAETRLKMASSQFRAHKIEEFLGDQNRPDFLPVDAESDCFVLPRQSGYTILINLRRIREYFQRSQKYRQSVGLWMDV